VTFWYAVIGSPYGDSGQGPNGRDTTELALRCQRASRRWDRLLGVEEQPPIPPTVQPIATIVRNLMFLPRSLDPSISSCLLDISGRKVLDLHAGANDVSRLSPGVYFVRAEPLAVSRKPSAVTVHKVILTR
jgi:hypothetical protein